MPYKGSRMTRLFPLFFATVLVYCAVVPAQEEPNADGINPVHPAPAVVHAAPLEPMRQKGFASLFDDAELTLRSTYYGRARSADNRGRPNNRPHDNEIHVNAFGQGVDFRSGYAWDIVGFDVSGLTNLGRGNGTSEVLLHKEPGNRDRSSATLGQAAVKMKLGAPDFGLEARGGFTPISIGSLGTSGGLHSHAYRGFETKFRMGDFWLGYGWADQFRNEWDSHYRDMTNAWHQNRWGNYGARHIPYVHSLGARYEFGHDKAGFIDAGVGEGKGYRRNAQLVVSVPVDLGCWGVLTMTGYGIAAKYREKFAKADKSLEYHVSGLAHLENGDWTFSAGIGHTSAPDSEEMQFRLTAWGNSDNRNFIQTWAQLDDFVWDGQNVVKAGVKYKLGNRLGLPGLSVGASYNFGWNARNPLRERKSTSWEANYHVEYSVQSGALKGMALGVYAGHLRYANNKFHGKQNRNDVKVILSYSKTLEGFLRWRK